VKPAFHRVVFSALLFALACLPPAGVRYPELPGPEDGALHMVFFDVGQADAMLIMYRDKVMLIDAGEPRKDPNRVEHRLPRRLDALTGSRHLDYFMVSHYHRDHFGIPGRARGARRSTGIFALIEREGVTVDTILDRGDFLLGHSSAGVRNWNTGVSSWLATGAAKQRRSLLAGDHIDMGPGLDVRVVTSAGNGQLDRLRALFPDLLRERSPSENDYSLGVKITLGDFELFTSGDLGGRNALRTFGNHHEIYNDMESRVAGEIGAVEVYRVNHHGSRFSSNDCFVNVLHPTVSVVSSGPNNYGHPDPDVYQTLKKYGDVRITGGADLDSWPTVGPDVVGGDVEIVVSPSGDRFWVNGVPYPTVSDAAEAARTTARPSCDDTLGQTHADSPHEFPEDGEEEAD
jgi:beta-lactamase superfamily II metal-dependent hydrolase